MVVYMAGCGSLGLTNPALKKQRLAPSERRAEMSDLGVGRRRSRHNHGHAQLTARWCGERVIGVCVGAQNMADAAIAYFQDV